MENAGEALQIAAAVLIFVLALSISINAFGEARQSAQIVLDYQDREYDYTYIVGNTTQRKVGVEAIVPAIYKAYKENYKIVFDTTKFGRNGLYLKKDKTGNEQGVYSIDLEKEVLGSDAQKERFIKAILYGPDPSTRTEFLTNLGIRFLHDEGIYGIIRRNKYTFVEKLGVYYQEELELQGTSNSPDTNKNKKRVITYADN